MKWNTSIRSGDWWNGRINVQMYLKVFHLANTCEEVRILCGNLIKAAVIGRFGCGVLNRRDRGGFDGNKA